MPNAATPRTSTTKMHSCVPSSPCPTWPSSYPEVSATARVSGFGGDKIVLALDGAGAVTLNDTYRKLDARLGGGKLTMHGPRELALSGARYFRTVLLRTSLTPLT